MTKLRFISVASLVMALASTTWARAASTPPPPISGCVNQTVSNGLWGLKVTNAVLGTEPGMDVAAYGVTMTLQNLGKNAEVPDSLGVGLPQVVLKDGTKLDISTDSQIAFGQAYSFTSFKPGMQVSGTYWFRTSDLINRAASFVLPISATNSVYNTPLGYKMKNPSLSVDLTCNKSSSPSPAATASPS